MSAAGEEARFAAAPVNGFFGFRLLERGPREARVALDARAELLQQEGFVQGGVLAALADTAAVWVLYPERGAGRTLTSIEFKLNFLRPGLAGAGELVAHARLVQRGRRVALVEADVLQGGRLLARGSFTYLVYERDEDGRGAGAEAPAPPHAASPSAPPGLREAGPR